MTHRHSVDPVALVFGIIFAGFTVVWGLWITDHLDDGGWWAGPVVLIVAGLAGLAAALRPSRPPAPPEIGGPAGG